jgi:hypothetical protein
MAASTALPGFFFFFSSSSLAAASFFFPFFPFLPPSPPPSSSSPSFSSETSAIYGQRKLGVKQCYGVPIQIPIPIRNITLYVFFVAGTCPVKIRTTSSGVDPDPQGSETFCRIRIRNSRLWIQL